MVRIPRKLLFKPVLIEWLDHIGLGSEWTDVKEAHEAELATLSTVAYLLEVTKQKVVLGSTLDSTKTETGDVTILVRSCVTSVKPLITQ